METPAAFNEIVEKNFVVYVKKREKPLQLYQFKCRKSACTTHKIYITPFFSIRRKQGVMRMLLNVGQQLCT